MSVTTNIAHALGRISSGCDEPINLHGCHAGVVVHTLSFAFVTL
jgi:hypothetical protein